MNIFLRISRPSGNGLVYLGYLSEQFLEGLPDTHQPNVVEKVGHKPGIQQVVNDWRTGGEGGKEEERGGRGGGRRRKRDKGRVVGSEGGGKGGEGEGGKGGGGGRGEGRRGGG